MTADKVTVNVLKNNTILKTITEPIETNNKQWKTYLKSLKVVQKSVNCYLTELVELEKHGGDNETVEEEEDDVSDDEEDHTDVKRKLEHQNQVEKKRTKIK